MRTVLSLILASSLLMIACSEPPEQFVTAPYLDDEALMQLDTEEFAPQRMLVGMGRSAMPATIGVQGSELTQLKSWDRLGVALYEVPAGDDVVATIRALRATGDYGIVEPDLVRSASYLPNDPFLSYQWNMVAIDAAGAWDSADGSGAVVAVIDTGVTSGPDDGLNAVTAGYDFVNNDNDPADDNGHGTHVSGTVAAATDNGSGVAGVAYGAAIMPVKVLDAAGSGYSSDVIDGIYYAANQGADVINMSLGSAYGSASEQAACDYAENAGVAVFGAAGNAGRRKVEYPAGYASVIGVGATDYNNVRAYYSNKGTHVELAAPGGDVYADENGDGYADGILQETNDGGWGYYFWQGTSMATPHAAGVAALLAGLGANNTEIRSILQTTATDLDAAGWDQNTGWGLIDAAAAVAAYAPQPSDLDGDGYAVADGDCDDADPAINPGATEIWYDGVDQDCDGASDYDADADGYDSDAFGGTDCDDTDAAVNPGAAEVWYDGIDQDCDGANDYDADADGYDSDLYGGADCDDTDAAVNPGAQEICDGADNDCDGLVDGDDPDATGLLTWYLDNDGDGYGDAATSTLSCSPPAGYVDNADDCDDLDGDTFPGATEICDDGIDQDCDGADEVCGGGAPVIFDVVSSPVKKTLTVSWDTDEPTTGLLCNSKGGCSTTGLGTSHQASVPKKGGSFTIEATDQDGNTTVYGPAAY